MNQMEQDVIRATERLGGMCRQLTYFRLGTGKVIAVVTVAEGDPAATEEEALRALAKHLKTMLDSNIDHDQVFRERLEEYGG